MSAPREGPTQIGPFRPPRGHDFGKIGKYPNRPCFHFRRDALNDESKSVVVARSAHSSSCAPSVSWSLCCCGFGWRRRRRDLIEQFGQAVDDPGDELEVSQHFQHGGALGDGRLADCVCRGAAHARFARLFHHSAVAARLLAQPRDRLRRPGIDGRDRGAEQGIERGQHLFAHLGRVRESVERLHGMAELGIALSQVADDRDDFARHAQPFGGRLLQGHERQLARKFLDAGHQSHVIRVALVFDVRRLAAATVRLHRLVDMFDEPRELSRDQVNGRPRVFQASQREILRLTRIGPLWRRPDSSQQCQAGAAKRRDNKRRQ